MATGREEVQVLKKIQYHWILAPTRYSMRLAPAWAPSNYKAICVPINSTPVAIKSINMDHSCLDLDDVHHKASTFFLLSHQCPQSPLFLHYGPSPLGGDALHVVRGSLQSIISQSFSYSLTQNHALSWFSNRPSMLCLISMAKAKVKIQNGLW